MLCTVSIKCTLIHETNFFSGVLLHLVGFLPWQTAVGGFQRGRIILFISCEGFYKHVRGWNIIIYNMSLSPSCGPPWLRIDRNSKCCPCNVVRICYCVCWFYHHSGFIVTAVQMTLKSVSIFLDLQDHWVSKPKLWYKCICWSLLSLKCKFLVVFVSTLY